MTRPTFGAVYTSVTGFTPAPFTHHTERAGNLTILPYKPIRAVATTRHVITATVVVTLARTATISAPPVIGTGLGAVCPRPTLGTGAFTIVGTAGGVVLTAAL